MTQQTEAPEERARKQPLLKSGWADRLLRGGAPWLSVILGLAALVLFVRILWAPSDIGSPTNESDALIRANERLLEMVKWTLSTILTVGGALIGLNWYQSTRRYDHDREALDRIRQEDEERWTRQERYFEQQVATVRESFGMVEDQFVSKVLGMVKAEINGTSPLVAAESGGSVEGESTDLESPRSGIVTGLAALWDNVMKNQANRRITQEVNSFITPYPFGDMKAQRAGAVRTILELLKSAKETGASGDELTELGAADAWRLFPLVVADYPHEASRIRSYLLELEVVKRDSDTTIPENHDGDQHQSADSPDAVTH